MKKFLLGTLTILSAFNITDGANAQGPTVSVGGFADFQGGYASQKEDFKIGPLARDYHTRSDTEVHVNVNGRTDSGLGYGAVIELEADVSAASDAQGVNADKTYLFLESAIGRFEAGSNTDAAQALKVDASTFARATGGIDGDWYHFVQVGGLNGQVPFIIRPNLPIAHPKGISEDANKITYYTPRMSGFQFGFDITPDQGEVGSTPGFSRNDDGQYENIINAGVNYTAQFDLISLAASLTGEFGKNELEVNEDLRAGAFGVNMGFAGFTFGGSYGSWGKSNQVKSTAPTAAGSDGDSSFYDIGGAYESGPYAVSLTYLGSSFAANDFSNAALGFDYKLAPGLTPYVEANFFKFEEGPDPTTGFTADGNKGTVVLIGTQLNF